MNYEMYFTIWRGAAFERIQKVTVSEVMIGRRKGHPLYLSDTSVSREHAVVTLNSDGYRIRDLGSRNGTILNGSPLQNEAQLNEADEVQIGPYKLKLYRLAEHASRAAEPSDESTRSTLFRRQSRRETELRRKKLTAAQLRVYDEFLRGRSEKEVAAELGISIHTVHSHSRAIYQVFEVSSRAELLAGCAVPAID